MKNTFTKFISRVLLILCFLFTGYNGFAQYTVNTITSGNGLYTAMAKDQSNNIYVVRNASGDNYEVVKFLGGDPAVSTVLITGLNAGSGNSIYPWGLAVNSVGDVFVTNSNQDVGWQIIKWRAATSTFAVIHTGNYYSSLAIDHSDNLLSIEYDIVSNNYQVWKYPAGMESTTGSLVYNGIVYPAGSYSFPWGLSVDSHNDIYFLGFLETNGGSLNKLSYPAYNSLTTLGTNRSFTSLTIDANDNLYTSEGTSPSAAQVVKYTYPVAVNATGTVIYSGLGSGAINYPWGLAVNSTGRIFANDGAAAGTGRVLRLDPPVSLVNSVTRLNGSPSNASTVNYAVTFNRTVTGVTASTFSLTTTSITGASIAGVSGSGANYVITVNTGTGDGTIRLDVNGTGVSPAVDNVPYITGAVYTIDRTAPTGSIVINSGATLTGVASVTLTLAATDANPGTRMQFSNDGSTYSALETLAGSKTGWPLSAGDGLKTVYVQYADAAGNVKNYSATITLDQTAPNTTIVSGQANPTNSSSATFTFTSTEAGNAFQYSLDGGSYTGATSLFTIVGLPEGSHTLSVRAIDPAGNTDATPEPYAWTVDQTAPTVTSVSGPANGYYKAGTSMKFVVKYSENVQVGTVGGIPYLNVILNSGTVRAYVTGVANNNVTFTYVVQAGDADMNGPVAGTLQPNGGYIQDMAGNTSSVTLQNVADLTGVFVNTTHPTVVISKNDPALVNHAVTVTATFSEAVTGFTTGDFSVVNATVTNPTTSDNITFTVSIVPIADGAVRVILPAASAVNIGGNDNSASDTLRFTYDATAPAIINVENPYDSIYIDKEMIDITVSYNENIVLDTTGGKPYLNLTIGTTVVRADLLSCNGGQLTFRYTVQMGDNDADAITADAIVLNGATMKDAAGNNAITLNGVGMSTIVYVNTVHPSVVVASTAPSYVTTAYTATITFSEESYGLQLNELAATNATLSDLQTNDNIIFTVLVTPVTNGTVTLSVPEDVAYYAHAGNTASNTLSRIYDIAAPVVSSVAVPANGYYQSGTNLNFGVQFNEKIIIDSSGGKPSLNVTIGSTLVQATLRGATTTTLNFGYTVIDGNLDMDGIAVGTLNLNGSTVKDSATNNAVLTLNNTGNTTGVFVNTVHPSVVVSTPVSLPVNGAFTATFTFSEAVTGFIASDITSNGTASNLQTTDNITYTALITPITDGIVKVTVPAAVAVNIGNNDNSASDTLRILYDGTAPEVTSVDVPADAYYKGGQTLDFTVHFNETVWVHTTGGTPYLNVVIGTETVKALYNSANGKFTYTVQSGQMDLDGIAVGTLELNGGTITDTVYNNAVLTLNSVASTTGILVNTATPSVVISTTAAARINTSFDVKLVFSEAVTGLLATDLSVTNGTAGNLQTTDNITYTATVTPVTDGTVEVSLPVDQAVNMGDNGNAASNTIGRLYDITAPVINAGLAFSTSERSPAGTLVGTVTAIETAGTLQNWTITSDESGGAFSIDNSGKIQVADATILGTHANTTVHLTFTVSDGLNISTTESVAITVKFVNQAPVLDTIASSVMCINTDEHTVQLTGASATETDQTYSFSIMADQSYFDALAVSATGLVTYKLKAGVAGTATITVTIKDDGGTSNGGIDSLRRSFTVTANSLPVVIVNSDSNNSAIISRGDIIHLTATGGESYSWSPAAGIISGQQSDILEARPMEFTLYVVTATSAAGCKDSASFGVNVVEDFKVDAVNIMSPNGDGKNDKWVIQNIDSYPNNEVKIFDRTGRMVYSRRNYNNEWDATMNGSPLAEGTYYYILTFGGGKTAKGFITIIRDRN
jgi:gliding motility-associated-like protein